MSKDLNNIFNIKSLFYDNESLIKGLKETRTQNEPLVSGAIDEAWSQFTNEVHSENDRILEALFQKYRSESLSYICLKEAFYSRIEKNNKLQYLNHNIRTKRHLLPDLIQREDQKEDNILIWRLELSLRYLESNPGEYESVKNFVDKEILPYTIGGRYYVPFYLSPQTNLSSETNIPLNFDLYVFDLLCQGEEFPKCFQERILKNESEKLWEDKWERGSVPDIAFRLAQMKQRIPPSIESTLDPGMHSSEMAIKQFRHMLLQSVIEVDGKYIDKVSHIVRSIEFFLGPRDDSKVSPKEDLDRILECIEGIKELKTIFAADKSVVKSMNALLDKTPSKSEPEQLSEKQDECFKLLLNRPEGMTTDDIKNHVGGQPKRSLNKLLQEGHVIKNDTLWQVDPCYSPKFLAYILDKKYTAIGLADTLIEHIEDIESPMDYLLQAFEIYDAIDRSDDKGRVIGAIPSQIEKFFKNVLISGDYEKDGNSSLEKKKLTELRSILLFQKSERIKLGWRHNKTLLDFMVKWTSYCIEYNVDSDLRHLGYDTLQDRYINVKGNDKENEILNYQSYLGKSTRMLIDSAR